MSKIKIKVTLRSENEVSEEEYLAIKTNNKIIYQEKNCMTTLFLDSNLKMVRSNEETNIELLFIADKKTTGICMFNNQILNLELLTDYVVVEEKVIIIKYKVLTTEQDVLYKMEVIG